MSIIKKYSTIQTEQNKVCITEWKCFQLLKTYQKSLFDELTGNGIKRNFLAPEHAHLFEKERKLSGWVCSKDDCENQEERKVHSLILIMRILSQTLKNQV